MTELPPIRSDIAFPRTVRLVPSARAIGPVLMPLVDSKAERDELAEIEGATSNRLVAQSRGALELDARELAFNVPNANFINAAFSYPRPQPNRFNGPTRGAWYAALDTETCIAEVCFHKERFLRDCRATEDKFDYAELHADLIGKYADMREWDDGHPALQSDEATAYPAGNALAREILNSEASGIIYPSARHEAGTCIAVLRPQALQAVVQGELLTLTVQVGKPPVVSAQAA